jgi:hypothetical protein
MSNIMSKHTAIRTMQMTTKISTRVNAFTIQALPFYYRIVVNLLGQLPPPQGRGLGFV